MPHRCCVPRCRGNYDGEPRVAVFGFPKSPTSRRKWLHAIKRDDYEITSSSKVCELHFIPEDIEREAQFFDEKRGTMISAPLQRARLKPAAFPKLLPNCPSYLQATPTCSRLAPNEKRKFQEMRQIEEAIAESIISERQHEEALTFNNLDELELKITEHSIPSCFTKVRQLDTMLFMNLELQPVPLVSKCIVLDQNLFATLFIGNVSVSKLSTFSFPFKCTNINTLSEILTCVMEISKSSNLKPSEHNVTKLISDLLNSLIVSLPEQEHTIRFLQEQVLKLTQVKHAYKHSPDFLIFSSLLFSISAHAYRYIRSSENIILPHPNTIKRICSKFNINPQIEQFDENFLRYIRLKFKQLTESDQHIVLLLDEIHLKSSFDFKGGGIVGHDFDLGLPATSAHVFMVQSLKSVYSDVAHILPVSRLSADQLHCVLKRVILGLSEIGFNVICTSTDNNSINRKAMSSFSTPQRLSIVYAHPSHIEKPLFFVIDTVHIMKCVRNNWLNQINDGQTIYYPDFHEPLKKVHAAKFKTLRKLHDLEMGNILKFGFGLTLKALYPNNLERQNMKLVLNIFNPHVIEGLRKAGAEHELPCYQETSNFLEVMYTWWCIVNVKSKYKGTHKRDKFMEPLTADDERRRFLIQFLSWLDVWKEHNLTTGTLTTETHLALSHTTYAILELSEHCINDLNFQYVLTGKLQTDPLERRFGRYRQLAGSQYSIGVRQVFEVENKLRLQSVLPNILKSNRYGNIGIDVFEDFNDSPVVPCNALKSLKVLVTEDDISSCQETLPLLMYVSGYCCHSYVKHKKCVSCKSLITLDRSLDLPESYDYIHKLDRGGLLYPHPDIFNAVMYNYIVVSQLISIYEDVFLRVPNQ